MIAVQVRWLLYKYLLSFSATILSGHLFQISNLEKSVVKKKTITKKPKPPTCLDDKGRARQHGEKWQESNCRLCECKVFYYLCGSVTETYNAITKIHTYI